MSVSVLRVTEDHTVRTESLCVSYPLASVIMEGGVYLITVWQVISGPTCQITAMTCASMVVSV